MENPQQDSPSEDQKASRPHEGKGYETPGRDVIIESTSSAVHSPSQTSRDRLQAPKSHIDSIGQTPGAANPAIAETTGFEHGEMSTADLLRAREFAEEEFARSPVRPQQYQDQGTTVSTQEAQDANTDNTGRPNWPNDEQQAPTDFVGSAHAGETLMTGPADVYGIEAEGRQDAAMERDRTKAARAEAGSGGLSSTGFDAAAEIYERRDMHAQSEPSEIERIAPGMTNIAPEEKDGEQ